MATAGGAWRQAASNLLDVLKEMDIGQIFAKPVNQQIYRDYSQYVSQPMDLGLVRQKLPSYRNAKQFATDVRLVFSNALAYCGRVDATPDFKAVATLAKKMQRRFDKDAPLRPYLAPTPLRNRTPPPVDENLAKQIAANDGKVAMPRDVETCVSRVHQSLKRVKAAQSFRTPIETERWTDYEPKVGGQALDLTSVEHQFKRGAFQQDCGAWVLRMRRISANCLRYNTDTRFPELRQDAKFYLKVRVGVRLHETAPPRRRRRDRERVHSRDRNSHAGPREGTSTKSTTGPAKRRLPDAGHRPSGAEIIAKLASDFGSMISASRGAAAPSRHRRASSPGEQAVGGFFFDFEAVRTESRDRDAPRRR